LALVVEGGVESKERRGKECKSAQFELGRETETKQNKTKQKNSPISEHLPQGLVHFGEK